MNDRPFESFLAFARHARSKPAFDVEERYFQHQAAMRLQRVLRAAGGGEPWREDLEAICIAPRFRTSFTTRPQTRAFADWAESADAALRPALAGFLEPDRRPAERVAMLADVAQQAGGGPDPSVLLAFGSLFNFAAEPDSLPFMRPRLYGELREILGEADDEARSVAEEYEQNLRFAREIERRLTDAGVPVRDMLDAAALILLAGRHRQFWAPDPPEAVPIVRRSRSRKSGGGARSSVYLSICAIYFDEGRYLREWIEFHRLVGVERFFLYDNRSTDDHRRILEPYIRDGSVVLYEWPRVPPQQLAAYEDCIATHGEESRWIAFIDLDEFLFSPTGLPLPELLRGYEPWPAVGVNWAMFGPSGHLRKPPGLVIESYVKRLDIPANETIKSVVDPRHVVRSISPHNFSYDRLGAVDENEYPIFGGKSRSVSFSRLRVNHYFTKSVAEYAERCQRMPAAPVSRARRVPPDAEKPAALEAEHARPDDAILRYLPALRGALEQR
jgi:hypothetical protein